MKTLNATYKGVITGGLMILLSVLFYYGLNLSFNGNNQYIILLMCIAGVLWSLFDHKRKGLTDQSFKNYFSEGFKTFIVIALFMAIYTFIFFKMNPQILEEQIALNDKLIVAQGDKTPDEISANADKLRSMFMPLMLATKTIIYLLLGSLVSVIGAGFLSQKNAGSSKSSFGEFNSGHKQ